MTKPTEYCISENPWRQVKNNTLPLNIIHDEFVQRIEKFNLAAVNCEQARKLGFLIVSKTANDCVDREVPVWTSKNKGRPRWATATGLNCKETKRNEEYEEGREKTSCWCIYGLLKTWRSSFRRFGGDTDRNKFSLIHRILEKHTAITGSSITSPVFWRYSLNFIDPPTQVPGNLH